MAREANDQDSARRELLAIQKRLWRRLKREIESSIADNPPNVEIYQEEYERDLARYEAVSSKHELVEAAAKADLVYVGDYHTLPQAQKTLVKLLLALCRVRRVVLAMEMVHIRDQPHLDAYLTDRIGEQEFLRRIDYERTWGFAWPPYREIFAVAQRRALRVIGINSDPEEHPHDHLLERDFLAAQVIADEVAARPDSLVLVFDGDLHVARDHLPFLVQRALTERGLEPRRQLIVHQNSEETYWQLARERREQVNVVRLAADAFCVLNASPIEKLHSYLNWVSQRPALAPPMPTSSWEVPDGLDALYGGDEDDEDEEDHDDHGAEYAEQVHGFVVTVARFLGIERDDLDAFTLFTVNDLDFFDYLLSGRGDFTQTELEDIKRQILSNESYFIPKGDIIYLADFSVVNAAEEATHFLHHLCSRYRWDRPRDLETDFYFRVVTEALGFFGSKLIVPTRECWRERDCEVYLERQRARRRAKRQQRAADRPFRPDETGVLAAVPEERVRLLLSQRLTLQASRLVLHHKQLEREFLESGRWRAPAKALTRPAELHLLITHMLGHMLGDKLYVGLLSGEVERERLRDLFHEPLEQRGVALARYLELVHATARIDHGPARGELL